MVEQLKPLTSLRGIAALMVVTHHFLRFLFPQLGEATAKFTQLIQNGYLWVDFFFLLSGFVLTHVYHSTFKAGLKKELVHQFISARFARIYPLHLFMLAPFLLVELLKFVFVRYQHAQGNLSGDLPLAFSDTYNLPDLLASIFLLQAFNFYPSFGDLTRWNEPAWSVSAEWLTYLVFPGLLLLCFRLNVFGSCLMGVLSFIGLFLVCGAYPNGSLDTAGVAGVIRCALECCLGVLTYRCYGYIKSFPSFRSSLMLYSDLGVILPLLLLVAVMHFNAYDIFVVPLFCWLILGCALNEGRAYKALSGAVPVFFGIISYSIYMVHWFIQTFINYASKQILNENIGDVLALYPSLLAFMGSLLMVIGVASLTYYFVEAPLRSRFKDLLGSVSCV